MNIQRLNTDREHLLRYLNGGIRFFMAAALTAAQLPCGSAPFALGWVAASGGGLDGIAALAGTGLGSGLFLSFERGLPHLAVAVLLVTAATALQGLPLLRRDWMLPAYAALLYAVVEGTYLLQAAEPLRRLPSSLTTAILTAVSAWLYRALLSEHPSERRAWGTGFLAVSLLTTALEIPLGSLSLGRCLLWLLLMTAARQLGISRGITVGIGIGSIADLFLGTGALFYTASGGVLGLLAGACAGRLQAMLLCGAGMTALLLPVTEPWAPTMLLEVLAVCPLFFLLSGRARRGKRLQRQGEPAVSPAAEHLKRQLSSAAEAFRELYDALGRGVPTAAEESPAVIFDRAAEKVCRGCALCQLCWKKEYLTTYNAFNDATPLLLERGRSLAKDYPSHFASRCIHLPELLTAINGETSAFLLRRQYRRQMEEAHRSARGQYARVGELLFAAAAGMEVPVSAHRLDYAIGAALRPREGESVCGDSVSSFETERGRLCLLLSDGSGSGEGARRESALTNRLLKQFLQAGIEPEAALRTLNSALALRSEETGSFATIDLLAVELRDGSAALYKYGAAPTYLKKGGSVRRITGHALPAGLSNAPGTPDVTRLRLEGGSFAVMVSDGVADALGDEWLQNLLAGWGGTDPQALAELILRETAQRGQLADDCGVQVLYLPTGDRSV